MQTSLHPTSAGIAPIYRWDHGHYEALDDELAIEEPLEIRVRGRAISVTMRTPGHDDELAAGFLLSEGVIKRPQDILRIVPCDRNEEENILNVLLAPDVVVDFERLTRHVFASSSCGLCGKASIDAVCSGFEPVESDAAITTAVLSRLAETMRREQLTFDRTGGLHAAGLFSTAGKLLVTREDVGRHNAVDKVLGRAILDGFYPLRDHVLLVSGRASFEIMQKALAGGIPIVAAVSAPSSLAVSFAENSGQTLIGFLRDQRMNIYSHPERVADLHG